MDTSLILLCVGVTLVSATVDNCGKGGCGASVSRCSGTGCGGGGGGSSNRQSAWSSRSSWSSSQPSSSSWSSWSSQSAPNFVKSQVQQPSRWSSWSSRSSGPSYSQSSQSGPQKRWWINRSYSSNNMNPRRVVQTTCRGNGCDRREQTETAHNQGGNGCASGRQSNGCNTNVNRNRQTGGEHRTIERVVERRIQNAQGPEPQQGGCMDSAIRSDFAANFNNWKGGEVNSCSELVQSHPEMCDNSQAIREDCCTSCSNREMNDCVDQLTDNNPIVFSSSRTITSCKQLARRFEALCNTYGGPGGLCCASCRAVRERFLKGEARAVTFTENTKGKGDSNTGGNFFQGGKRGGGIIETGASYYQSGFFSNSGHSKSYTYYEESNKGNCKSCSMGRREVDSPMDGKKIINPSRGKVHPKEETDLFTLLLTTTPKNDASSTETSTVPTVIPNSRIIIQEGPFINKLVAGSCLTCKQEPIEEERVTTKAKCTSCGSDTTAKVDIEGAEETTQTDSICLACGETYTSHHTHISTQSITTTGLCTTCNETTTMANQEYTVTEPSETTTEKPCLTCQETTVAEQMTTDQSMRTTKRKQTGNLKGQHINSLNPKGLVAIEEVGSTKAECVDREMGKMKSKGPGLTCQDFVARDPCNCNEIKEECCASCASIDLNTDDCQCRNLLSSVYPYYITQRPSEKLMEKGIDVETLSITITSCSEIVARFPMFCSQIGNVNQLCCRACRDANLQTNTCIDQISSTFPISLSNGDQITDCGTVASDYKEFCKQYGGENGLCCESCRNIDTSCVNSALRTWLVDGVAYNCEEYVRKDPCNCETVRDYCCESCKNIDLRKCQCRNNLSPTTPYIVTGVEPARRLITSCYNLVSEYPEVCESLGGLGNACCQACNYQGLTCLDLLTQSEPLILDNGDVIISCDKLVTEYTDLCSHYGVPGGPCCRSCKEFSPMPESSNHNHGQPNNEDNQNIDYEIGNIEYEKTESETLINHDEDGLDKGIQIVDVDNESSEEKEVHGSVTFGGGMGVSMNHNEDVNIGRGMGHHAVRGVGGSHPRESHNSVNINNHGNIHERGMHKENIVGKEEFYEFKGHVESQVNIPDILQLQGSSSNTVLEGDTVQLTGAERIAEVSENTIRLKVEKSGRGGRPAHPAAGQLSVKGPEPSLVVEEASMKGPSESQVARQDRIEKSQPTYVREEYSNKGPSSFAGNQEESYSAKGPSRGAGNLYEVRTRSSGCIDRPLGKMRSKGPGLTCRDYISRDFCHCEEVGEECCETCHNINLDVPECKCRDLLTERYPFYIFPYGSDQNDIATIKVDSCWEIVTEYPQFCAQIGAPGQDCCRSCQSADLQYDCMDQLTEENYLEYIPQGRISNCGILVRDYRSLCREHGGRGGKCCDSCRNVDTESPMDDALMYWEIDGKTMNCRDYVHYDRCRCLTVRDDCPESCKNLDMKDCMCQDFLSAETPYYVMSYDKDNRETRTEITSCDYLARYYPQFCRELSAEGQACCRTCRYFAQEALTKGK